MASGTSTSTGTPEIGLIGFGTTWQHWNPQAWFDWIMVRLMMSKVGDVIPKTYVPILRLVAEDSDQVDEAYQQVLSQRELIHFTDSPRDKWRKIYGAYIRELEWVYGELQKYFSHQEYEELVVDIMARNIRDAMSAFLPNIEKMTRSADAEPSLNHKDAKRSSAGRFVEKLFNGKLGSWMFKHMNPMSPIVGPAEMKMSGREIELSIPECWMHTAPGDGRTQDQACLQACKGACEAVFNGRTPIAMNFDPHLPEYGCTITVKLGETVTRQTATQ